MRFRFHVPVHVAVLGVAVALSPLILPPVSQARDVPFDLVLSGKAETPPNPSHGKGAGHIVFDDATKELRWNIHFSDLSGDAMAAHFHGPAKPGQAAGVLVAIPGQPPLLDPIVGSATLTDAQIDALRHGLIYFNIHTKAYPGGEIRGQVVMHHVVRHSPPAPKAN
jgi:hypothetical protein